MFQLICDLRSRMMRAEREAPLGDVVPKLQKWASVPWAFELGQATRHLGAAIDMSGPTPTLTLLRIFTKIWIKIWNLKSNSESTSAINALSLQHFMRIFTNMFIHFYPFLSFVSYIFESGSLWGRVESFHSLAARGSVGSAQKVNFDIFWVSEDDVDCVPSLSSLSIGWHPKLDHMDVNRSSFNWFNMIQLSWQWWWHTLRHSDAWSTTEVWGDWTDWSVCQFTCGGGESIRPQPQSDQRPVTWLGDSDVTRWLGAVMSSWCSDLARPLDAFEIQNQFLRNIEIHQFHIYNFIKFINFIYNFMNFQIVPDVSGFAGLERWRLWLRERGSPAKEAPKTPEFLSWREAKISFGQCQSMKNTQFLRGAHELQFVTPVSRKPMPYCSESGWWKLEFFYTLHLWKLFANPLFMLASNMFELCCTLHVVMTIDTLAISQHPKRWKSNL